MHGLERARDNCWELYPEKQIVACAFDGAGVEGQTSRGPLSRVLARGTDIAKRLHLPSFPFGGVSAAVKNLAEELDIVILSAGVDREARQSRSPRRRRPEQTARGQHQEAPRRGARASQQHVHRRCRPSRRGPRRAHRRRRGSSAARPSPALSSTWTVTTKRTILEDS